jgi:riboflavin kinase/FMN adenylyltransferase
VEIHIPDWEGDLYGKFVEFELAHPLRGEQKFDSVDSLKAQIGRDVESWKALEKTGFEA